MSTEKSKLKSHCQKGQEKNVAQRQEKPLSVMSGEGGYLMAIKS